MKNYNNKLIIYDLLPIYFYFEFLFGPIDIAAFRITFLLRSSLSLSLVKLIDCKDVSQFDFCWLISVAIHFLPKQERL